MLSEGKPDFPRAIVHNQRRSVGIILSSLSRRQCFDIAAAAGSPGNLFLIYGSAMHHNDLPLDRVSAFMCVGLLFFSLVCMAGPIHEHIVAKFARTSLALYIAKHIGTALLIYGSTMTGIMLILKLSHSVGHLFLLVLSGLLLYISFFFLVWGFKRPKSSAERD